MVTYDPITSTFYLRIALRHLVGFFDDYKRIFIGKHILILIRVRNDYICFKVFKDKIGELTITNMELKVKHLFLNDVKFGFVESNVYFYRSLAIDLGITRTTVVD